MLELGPAGEQLHIDSGCHMAIRKMDIVIGVRGQARKIVEAAGTAGVLATFLETPEEAGEWLAREARPGDAILLKASRGSSIGARAGNLEAASPGAEELIRGGL